MRVIINRVVLYRRMIAVWATFLLTVLVLGLFRVWTNAEYALASIVIIPVVLVAWEGGIRQGTVAAVIAASMWVVSDLHTEEGLSAPGVSLVNGVVRLLTYCFVAYLVARVRTLLRQQSELAMRDPLTGLMNRRAFLEAGAAESSRSQRYGHSVAVIFLDLDNFKKLNDNHGHDTGDAALKAVADEVRRVLRVTDSAARLGGDEFAFILPQVDNGSANVAGRKVAAAVAAALAPFPPVTASIGIAWFEQANGPFSVMLKEADSLMYAVKREGKTGIRIKSFAR